ncbi:penicillin-insensitive murein endopeptidase [Sodalis sp.]|uniref:penicillin-insensitive murein endopeptidase n=1 Tax=Sodalis sp. (in: enterobacteria) TaxID=1898979 RepID=UPI0038739486
MVGAQLLPLEVGNDRVLRPNQRRYFSHPDLLLPIQRLSNQVKHLGLGEVLVGDMAMLTDGRFSSGL